MQRLLLLIPFFALPFCSGNKHEPVKTPSPPVATIVKDSLPGYDFAKHKVIATRDSIGRYYARVNDIESRFTNSVVHELIRYWYGTPWDFNGITQQPGKGQIACGYFVTTVLRDAGYKVNRVKVAQMPASEIIRQVADKKTIRAFSLQPVSKIDSVVKRMGPGLYVVGLDYHVGFLYCDGAEVYFIHSNYIGREGVVKEPVMTSRAFGHSRLRVIGKVSTVDCLEKNWLGQTVISSASK
jgi:hypothetical protein